MSILWQSSDIAAAVAGVENGSFSTKGMSIDTRTLQAGDLFIALKGPNFDGHHFIAAAFEKGAAGVLTETPITNGPHVLVKDTATSLRDLGKAARDRTHAKMIAITGSVGKTSTKEMLRLICSTFGAVHASTGNLNNHWGVPLSLARMESEVDFGVFELGMNHAGEIGPLSKMVRPDIAIITEVAAAHLEFFSSVAEIADAKAEILEGLSSQGAAILPEDNAHIDRLKAHALQAAVKHLLTFGGASTCHARLTGYEVKKGMAVVRATIGSQSVTYQIGAIGKHLAMNSLAVLAAVDFLGLDLHVALGQFERFTALAGRGKRDHVSIGLGQEIELIDESYNASPASMRAALQMLVEDSSANRLIAVLGDMRELGAASSKLHADLADYLVGKPIDRVFLCGPFMAHLWERVPDKQRGSYKLASADLIQPVLEELRGGDRVLVKGSLGTQMAPIVQAIVAGGKRGVKAHAV